MVPLCTQNILKSNDFKNLIFFREFLWAKEYELCFTLQGIEYLVTNGLLNDTAEDVAAFLFEGEGLSKTQIGNYLGEK